MNSGYYDIIYGYLQLISQWDGSKTSLRYIPKKGFTISGAAQDCGISRSTFAKYFKGMLETAENIEKGNPILLRELKDRYELLLLDKSLAMLVPYNTLIVLVSALNNRAISIYVYLLNRYYATIASGNKSFIFTIDSLKSLVGLSVKNRGKNNEIIKGILLLLKRLGLINWQEMKAGTTDSPKTYYVVTYMTNDLEATPPNFDKDKSQELYNKLQNDLVVKNLVC